MIKEISKRQIRGLELEMQEKKENDARKMTIQDKILDLFIPVRVGIYKNGLTAQDIAEAMGAYEFKDVQYIRTHICQLASNLVKEGFPFGGLKDGKYKKYGFPKQVETEEIEWNRKERMSMEIKAGLKYLDESDPMFQICSKVSKEFDKQLKLFYLE